MRVEHWPDLLAAYLDDTRPLVWGERDCALWVAGWVAQCTGQDYTGDWLGRYHTEAGAYARMKKLGFASVADIASAHLRTTLVALAQRGDLVLHPSGSLGICNGLRSQFLTAEGVLTEATLACTHAWSVD